MNLGQISPFAYISSVFGADTATACFAPIAGCLMTCEKVVKSNAGWQAINEEQKRFLAEYYFPARNEVKSVPELECIASPDAEVINKFLRERGFAIQLQPFEQLPPRIGMASVFKLLLEWAEKGKVTDVRRGRYPAVRLDNSLLFSKSRRAPHPIVSITAKNGDAVSMTIARKPLSGFDLVKEIELIENSDDHPVYKYGGVIFPMISYDEEVDIGWIKGMETEEESGPWMIEQALQQTKFRMNEVGAKVESAVAMSAVLGYCGPEEPKPDLIIDKPFLLWVTRPGMSHPLFVGYFTETNWKRPDSL